MTEATDKLMKNIAAIKKVIDRGKEAKEKPTPAPPVVKKV